MNEEREREELGLLPEDLQRERAAIISTEEQGAIPPGAGIPPDIQRQESVAEIPSVGDRLASQGADVESVYDARPINAVDFLQTFTLSEEISGVTGFTVREFDYFIPGGYIGVLRGFHYEFENPVSSITRDGILSSILANDIVQIGYDNMKLGQITVDPQLQPCFALAPLNGKFTLRLRFDADAIKDSTTDLVIFVKLYGNLLLSRGVPLNFEIGNYRPTKPIGRVRV